MTAQGFQPQRRLFEYGWITSALLLFFLSLIPFLLPMADAIPELAKPDAQPIAARRHDRVVVLLVDGLGYKKAVKSGLMPHLEARIGASAFGMALASFPTITPTGLRAIFSGHRMVSEPQLPTGMRTSSEADSVMARAAAASLKTFVIGQFTWAPIFPGCHGAKFIEIPYAGVSVKYGHGTKELIVNYDDVVLRRAAPILAGDKGPWDLLVLHLFEPDSIAHAMGTEDALYGDHLRWLDLKIEELSRELQEGRPTTILLLADHGQAPDGSHGGLTAIERQVPFMLWGADVRPGDLGTFPLYNAAPTLCALLGIPPPSLTEGWPMLDAVPQSARRKAEILMDLARQRAMRWRTVKAVLPRVAGDPPARLAEIQAAFVARKYEAAAAQAERLARSLDRAMVDALPERWLWRLIAALWSAVFAACFGLAWRRMEIKSAAVAAFLSLSCLMLLVFPLLQPSLWGWASGLVLSGCMGILLLTILPGLRAESGLDWFGWGLWWFAFAGIAFQEILDVSLWSWLVLAGLFAARLRRLTKGNAFTTAVSLLAALVCVVVVSGKPSTDVSLIRALIPDFSWPAMSRLNWGKASGGMLASLLAGGYFPFVRFNERPRPWATYAFVFAPLVAAYTLMLWNPSAGAWSFGAGALSLSALVATRPSSDLRGIWLSVVCLTYYRTLADERDWCLLALAVVVGCCLSWRSRDAHPLWEGMGLLAIGFWSFKLSGGQLTFSRITVAEGSRLLGNGWHPYALFALLTLKPLAAIGAPIMPRLSLRSLYSVLGTLPLFGALTAGNITMIWWSRFMLGGNQRFTDDVGYAQAIFVLLLAWGVLALWAAVHAMEEISWRLSRD